MAKPLEVGNAGPRELKPARLLRTQMDGSTDCLEISQAGFGELGLLNQPVRARGFDGSSRCLQSLRSLESAGGFRLVLNLPEMLVVLVAVAGLDLN